MSFALGALGLLIMFIGGRGEKPRSLVLVAVGFVIFFIGGAMASDELYRDNHEVCMTSTPGGFQCHVVQP